MITTSKFLVTGGAGFIGSNLVGKLVDAGHDVRVVDDLSTGNINNIKHNLGSVDFLYGDLSDYDIAVKAVDGVEYIVHLAANPSVQLSIEDPVLINKSIITSTLNLLMASKEVRGIKRIVQSTSSSAYGNSPVTPKNEGIIADPLSPYAVAKITQEYYGKIFHNLFNLQVISLRYFNVFGPKQNIDSAYSAVIPKFINLMLDGKPPIIYGDGLSSRDFIYIDNVVAATLSACECEWNNDMGVINIGCGESITLNDLVGLLNKIICTDIKPIHEEPKKSDVRHSVADINKAKKILGFRADVNLYQGLIRTIDWYRNNRISNDTNNRDHFTDSY